MPLDQLHRPGALPASTRRQVYRSTKSYGHAEGLSCAFRQWRAAHSHCRLVHGYALAFKFVFMTHELDEHNWCFDFGGLKPIKAWLHEMFDHRFLVAEDDPEIERFKQLDENGLIALRVVPAVGCEAIAHMVFDHVARFVAETSGRRVWLEQVEVREHSGNSAIYSEEDAPPLRVSNESRAELHQGVASS
jgi:6-pyruvoyltetrahydropterin/6-carboxytetrahydropterin synthase